MVCQNNIFSVLVIKQISYFRFIWVLIYIKDYAN